MQRLPRLFHTFLAAALFATAPLFAAPTPPPPPLALPAAPASDLPVDPAIHFGRLPNGFRYAIRANAEPKQRASLRLFVHAGSFEETDAQRGLAHGRRQFRGRNHENGGISAKGRIRPRRLRVASC